MLAVGRFRAPAEETAAMAREGGGSIVALEQDITSADAPRRVLDAATETFGRIDGLVNNAGIGAARSAHLTADEDFDRFMDVNLRAVFRLSRDYILDRKNKGGAIVNLASVFALTGYPGSAPYSAAKAAIIGLTRQMAADYGRDGFRVNAIAPGMIMTPIHSEERQKAYPDYYRSFVNGTPMGTTADASVIASAIAFLCSDAARFVSGHDRRRREEEVQAALDQQTMLLRERNHRVKNNLQMVTSILQLQASRTGTSEAAEELGAGHRPRPVDCRPPRPVRIRRQHWPDRFRGLSGTALCKSFVPRSSPRRRLRSAAQRRRA